MSRFASLLASLAIVATAASASAQEVELVPVPPGVQQPGSLRAAPAPVADYDPAEAVELVPVPAGVAQPGVVQTAPRPFPDRSGFTIGVAAGPGWVSADGQDLDGGTTMGLSLRAGSAISPSFLLQLNLEGVRTENQSTKQAAQLSFIGGSLQAYLHPRVYLLGGVGVARLSIDREGDIVAASERAPGVLFGGGVELFQTNDFALSLEARFIAASFADYTSSGSSVQLGFQWW